MIWCSMSRFYLSGVCLLEFWYASLVGILSWKTFSLHTDGTHLRKKLKYTVLSSYFCLFQNCLIDLLTSKGSCFKTKIKNIKCCFAKKKKKEEESVLNCKPIFLRSKDVLLSVLIFNLPWWLFFASYACPIRF